MTPTSETQMGEEETMGDFSESHSTAAPSQGDDGKFANGAWKAANYIGGWGRRKQQASPPVPQGKACNEQENQT